MTHFGLLRRYRSFLPVTEKTPSLSLNEGNTPLLFMPRLSETLGIELHVKYEGLNPTGSFKDRGMVLAVAKALENQKNLLLCASTGNTSASAAAYAARAGIRCAVIIPNGYIALGKLAQAVIAGAQVIAIDGNFDEALRLVREIADQTDVALVNSVNPYRLEGQKTAAFEVVDTLGKSPDLLAIPVGNAGNISAYWKGFCEYHQMGRLQTLPRLLGVQAAGAAPLVLGHSVASPDTLASAIRIGHPASGHLAKQAVSESNGSFESVTDDEILEAYRALAQEGVFCEPASAAPVAGLFKLHRQGRLPKGLQVVAVLTGHGLKDPDTALSAVSITPKVVSASTSAILSILEIH